MSVLVVMEQARGAWHRVSWEALAAAEKLQQPVQVAVLGSDVGSLARELAAKDVERVFAIDHALLEPYTPDAYVVALEQLIRKLKPDYVLLPHTYQVRDFAPRLATRFKQVLVSDVIDIQSGTDVIFVRQLFQGKLNADIRCSGSTPYFASVQAGAFRSDGIASGTAEIENVPVELDGSQIRSHAEEPFREADRAVDLSSAELIVSVGRGIQEQDNLQMVEDLASALGAQLAASRPICDNGWMPMERQVGSSGQTVSPKVYFAIGISGAIQHLVGMKGAKTIVAINKDPEAPIFEVADYGIVGDLFEIVPALTEAVKKARS